MKLSTFILNNHKQILTEWEEFAATLIPTLPLKLLRDHAEELLDALVADMETAQSEHEQDQKSRGEGKAHKMSESGIWHATHRLETGFTLDHGRCLNWPDHDAVDAEGTNRRGSTQSR